MSTHRVIWEIDLEADSPEEAARKALDIHRDENSIATVFTVIDEDRRIHQVDLTALDNEETAEMSVDEFNGVLLSNLTEDVIQKAAEAGSNYIRWHLRPTTPPEGTEFHKTSEELPAGSRPVWLNIEPVTGEEDESDIFGPHPGWYSINDSGEQEWRIQLEAHDGPEESGATRRLIASYMLEKTGGVPLSWATRELPERQKASDWVISDDRCPQCGHVRQGKAPHRYCPECHWEEQKYVE